MRGRGFSESPLPRTPSYSAFGNKLVRSFGGSRSSFRRNQSRRSSHPKRPPLFGREHEGGGALREAAFLAVALTPAGRGGSVSRRDHNQAYRRPHPTLRRNQLRRKVASQTPAALREEHEGGGLSEKPPSSPCPYPQQVAAALSAVVTITKPIGDRIQRSGGTN